jgi:hypothetical protein
MYFHRVVYDKLYASLYIVVFDSLQDLKQHVWPAPRPLLWPSYLWDQHPNVGTFPVTGSGLYAAITAMGCIADSEFHGARRLYEDVSIGRVPLWWWQVVNDILIY